MTPEQPEILTDPNIKNRRKERKGKTAEDFTPAPLVNEILEKLSEYSEDCFTDPTKTYLDPACGDGNILVEILRQKIVHDSSPLQALQTVFGCDIMRDNIQECRIRLLKVVQEFNFKVTEDMCKAVLKNIVWTSLKNYKNGSLDYDFEFSRTPDKVDVQRLWEVMTGKRKADEKDVQEDEPDAFANFKLTFG